MKDSRNVWNSTNVNYDNIADEDLIRIIKSGDKQALNYLIDKYKETDNELDREKLVEAILKDFYGYNRQTMNDYLRFKNEKDNPK